LRAWAPFDADRNLGASGAAVLTMVGGADAPDLASHVSRAEAPRVLEYTWGPDRLRWELEEIPGGTRLTLRHTMSDQSFLPKAGAGWHICIDVLERYLAGNPVGRIVANKALEHGWERLNREYATQLGAADSGSPAAPARR